LSTRLTYAIDSSNCLGFINVALGFKAMLLCCGSAN